MKITLNKSHISKYIIWLLCLVIVCFGLVPEANASEVSDSGQLEIPIILNGTDKGVNLQGGCLEQVTSSLTDFYIVNGKIICLNGAKINGVSSQGFNDSLLNQLLSPENLKCEMDASVDMVYTIISPRGYFGVAILTSIDKSKNIYKGIAISSSLDNVLKQQIVESSDKRDEIYTDENGMDVFPTGEMDVLESGGFDYFDTEMSSDITKIVFEGKQVQFKLPPRKYSDGEILVLLKDIAPLFDITTSSEMESGLETTYITKGSKKALIQAYSQRANIGLDKIMMKRAPKMDSNGILVPLSFLSSTFDIHFTISEDNKVLSLSKKAIVEWKYSGYNKKEPYAEYESKYVDGIKTTTTRPNGKNHVFKNVTIYNIKTGQAKVVPENKVDSYKKEYSITPPPSKSSSTANNSSSAIDSLNSYYNRMNMKRFLQSSTFNTWGGQMIRRITP